MKVPDLWLVEVHLTLMSSLFAYWSTLYYRTHNVPDSNLPP